MSEAGTHTLTGRDVKVLAFIAGAFGVYVAGFLLTHLTSILAVLGQDGAAAFFLGSELPSAAVMAVAAIGVGWTLRSRSLVNWAACGAVFTWPVPLVITLAAAQADPLFRPVGSLFHELGRVAIWLLFGVAMMYALFHLGALLRRRFAS